MSSSLDEKGGRFQKSSFRWHVVVRGHGPALGRGICSGHAWCVSSSVNDGYWHRMVRCDVLARKEEDIEPVDYYFINIEKNWS